MDSFVSRKRRRSLESHAVPDPSQDEDEDSTELKIAILSSLHPSKTQEILFDYLLAYDGSVDKASQALQDGRSQSSPSPGLASQTGQTQASPRKSSSATGYQSSLSAFAGRNGAAKVKKLTKKGQTLHLYSPEDIEQHTPCSIIHNFLPSAQAELLLKELLEECQTYRTEKFQMFDRTVESPHTFAFYVDSLAEVRAQKTEYTYNGGIVPEVRQSTEQMLLASSLVQEAVNKEIQRRIRDFNPGQTKLQFQSSDVWKPNTSFVNCYDGGKEGVGYHSDQLTYLGPRAVIGSLSLGVAREFRVRKIVPADEAEAADTQGQIAIHLPHNSLLVMHAEMQEEWKHAIVPTRIDTHPVAGSKRLNVTYRCYQPYLHPKYTPRCKCGVPTVLRCVQKRKATRGRYMWMCHAGYTPGEKGCSWFEWANLDCDGRPEWADGYKGNANVPVALEEGVPC